MPLYRYLTIPRVLSEFDIPNGASARHAFIRRRHSHINLSAHLSLPFCMVVEHLGKFRFPTVDMRRVLLEEMRGSISTSRGAHERPNQRSGPFLAHSSLLSGQAVVLGS